MQLPDVLAILAILLFIVWPAIVLPALIVAGRADDAADPLNS